LGPCVKDAVRLMSWNVNSLPLRFPHLSKISIAFAPDVICLQETKIDNTRFPFAAFKDMGYHYCETLPAQKGRGGLAVLSKIQFQPFRPLSSEHLLALRFQRIRLCGFELINIHIPAGGYVANEIESPSFDKKIKSLEAAVQIVSKGRKNRRILLGDINVAPEADDVWDHQRQRISVSHSPLERQLFSALLEQGELIDAMRWLRPLPEKLWTCWAYRVENWQNRGGRIDHFLVSRSMKSLLKQVFIAADVRLWERPSDHAPIFLDLKRPTGLIMR